MLRTVNISGLSLVLALVMCHVGQSQTASPTPADSTPYTAEAAAPASSCSSCTSCDPAAQDSCNCCDPRCRRLGFVQMPPHYPYFPAMHGYYYFRPYNGSMLRPQQVMAVTFGCDPRAPYDNQIFQQVYAEAEAAQK